MHLERLVKKMEEGKIVCGVCVSLNDPAVSELVGMAGYDFVWIEGEHGAMGLSLIHIFVCIISVYVVFQ